MRPIVIYVIQNLTWNQKKVSETDRNSHDRCHYYDIYFSNQIYQILSL